MSLIKSISPKGPATELATTAIVLAWHSHKKGGGHAKDRLAASVTTRLAVDNVYLWCGSSQGVDPYPDIPAGIKRTIILPIFMCHGFMLRAALPGLVKKIDEDADNDVICLPSIGQHDELTHMLMQRAIQTAEDNALCVEDTHLVMVAHGSVKHPESAQSTRNLVKLLREKNLFAGVHESFLEQPPYPDIMIPTFAGPVIAEGLFLTVSRHYNDDFPAAIARANRPVFTTPTGGISADPRFMDLVCDILGRELQA